MARPAKNLKLEQRIEIARRFAKGESAKDLSVAFGVSTRQVNRLAKEEAGDGAAVRDPTGIVSFRATQSELSFFDVEWQERGYANRSQALNAVLRGRCGFLDVPRDLVEGFAAAWRQAKDVSDAGQALAKAVHRGKLEVSSEDRALLIALVDLTQKMSRELGQMKEAARVQRHRGWPKAKEEIDSSGGQVSEALLEPSGSEFDHPSRPLGKSQARMVREDNSLKNRRARYG